MQFFDFFNRMTKKGRILLSLILGTAMALILFYVFLPPINPCSVGFWVYLLAVLFFYLVPFLKPELSPVVILGPKKSADKPAKKQSAKLSVNKWAAIPLLIPIAAILLGLIISSEFFFARRYASVITVTEAEFSEDMPKTDMAAITNIALMDSDSAAILGTRTLGSLSHVVSQYTLSGYYAQINYHNTPKKISNLEYDGFFKWLGNRKSGVPFTSGIHDPLENALGTYALLLSLDDCSLVTSGSYFRYFEIDGVRYHHLIDPETARPADRFVSVSVLGKDSGVCDALSTALFVMDRAEGEALVDSLEGYEAVWILPSGEMLYTKGMEKYIIEKQ